MIPKRLANADLEKVYDLIAEAIDQAPEEKRSLMLAKLALALANLVGDVGLVEEAVAAALRDI